MVKKKFIMKEADGWIYIINKNPDIESDRLLNEECSKEYQGVSGKYLFFSTDRDRLIALAKTILQEYGLSESKVSFGNGLKGQDLVLCIYDYKNRFANDLRKYADEDNDMKYRYWKSNKDTILGYVQSN